MNLSDKKLAAFDFDGVLADTEPLHKLSKEIMADRVGAKIRPDAKDFVGLPNRDYWLKIINDNDIGGVEIEYLERGQYDILIEIAFERKLRPTAGAEDLLDLLAGRGLRLAVCSSSERFYLEKMLAVLGLAGRFEYLVGGDEVPRKKPAPDVYLRALELTGLSAAEGLAVEDSAAGVAAALAAGYFTIGFINPGSGTQNLERADARVSSLKEIMDLF